MKPATGSYTVGGSVTLDIRENSGQTAVNSVESDISYPSSLLQYVSYSVASSAFSTPITAPSLGTGDFKYPIVNTSALTGDQEVLSVSFKVLAPGTATVSFESSSAVVGAGVSENAATSGATLTLTSAVTTPVTPVTPPPTVSVPVVTPAPTPAPVVKAATNTTKTSITPSGSSTPVALPSGSSVEVTAPATVEPTDQVENTTTVDNPIVKVIYLLNGKIIDTETVAPFSYKLDTTKLLNGKYTMTTDTYYASGTMTTSTQAVTVANPASLKQLQLAAKKYGPETGVILLILLILILLLITRHRIGAFFNRRYNTPVGTPNMDSSTFINPYPTMQQPGMIAPPPPAGPSQDPGAVYSPQPQNDNDNTMRQ